MASGDLGKRVTANSQRWISVRQMVRGMEFETAEEAARTVIYMTVSEYAFWSSALLSLGIDIETSHAFEREISRGCEGIKPGWVRVNFNYFISDEVFDYIVEAVRLVAREGWRLLGDYRFEPDTGLWRHRRGAIEPPMRLRDVSYDDTGAMTYPHHDTTAPVSVLADYMATARTIMAEATAPDFAEIAHLTDDFDQLRWFELPAGALVD